MVTFAGVQGSLLSLLHVLMSSFGEMKEENILKTKQNEMKKDYRAGTSFLIL